MHYVLHINIMKKYLVFISKIISSFCVCFYLCEYPEVFKTQSLVRTILLIAERLAILFGPLNSSDIPSVIMTTEASPKFYKMPVGTDISSFSKTTSISHTASLNLNFYINSLNFENGFRNYRKIMKSVQKVSIYSHPVLLLTSYIHMVHLS